MQGTQIVLGVSRTDDGHHVRIAGDGLDTDHLDYGYARTVHRTQGATHQRAHILAAGGGRELAYVALSRAREHTTIHTTADNLEQAVDDLQADWSTETHQRWIADTPAETGHEPAPEHPTPTIDTPTVEPSPQERMAAARHLLIALEDDYHDLRAGTGRWRETPEGAAARAVHDARDQLEQARRAARNPDIRRKDRRAATRALPELESTFARAQLRWQEVGEPVAERLQGDVHDAHREIDRLEGERLTQRLDTLQQRSAGHVLEPDLGISL